METLPTTRAEARACKSTLYMTGKMCSSGHIAIRYTSNGMCRECGRARDPVAYTKNREAVLARHKRNNAIPEVQAKKKIARKTRMARERECERARVAANREAYNARKKAARLANPERVRAWELARRAKKIGAGGTHTASDIREIKTLQRNRCAHCRKILVAYDVDHIIPLARGGSNSRDNLQIMCPSCNRRKSALHPIEFAQREGRLL